MITWLLLAAIAAALVWLACETRRVHQALDHYARAFDAWKTMLEEIEDRRARP
jgi:hypothetical protein